MKKLLLIMLLATTVAHAETFTWTDSEGTVHFSESRGEIPERFRKSTEPIGMGSQSGSSDKASDSSAVRPAELRKGGEGQATVPHQMEELKERMLQDEGIMALIGALQDEPEIQALLKDPAVLSAAQAGDIATLMSNPAILRALNNPRVREIGKKLGTAGEGTK